MAILGLLTSSWVLEVGDRANALQNELSGSAPPSQPPSSSQQQQQSDSVIVKHEDGTVSTLPPVSDFLKADLSAPLLAQQKSAKKLDEYRSAYRSWRTGSHQGATDKQLQKLRPHLTYRPGRHRALLPLQLLPPWMLVMRDEEDGGKKKPADDGDIVGICAKPQPALTLTANSSRNASAQSLDGAEKGRGQGGKLTTRDGGGAGVPRRPTPSFVRQQSFSEDLANALLQLPPASHRQPLDSSTTSAYEPPQPPPPQSSSSTSPLKAAVPPALSSSSFSSSSKPDWSVPAEISALEITQLTNIFLGPKHRMAWIGSIAMLHFSAMWACASVWVLCAQASIRAALLHGGGPEEGGGGGSGLVWLTEMPFLLALCAAVLLPLSAVGGAESVQQPLATATLTTLALMCVLLIWGCLAEGDSGGGRGVVFGGFGGRGGGGEVVITDDDGGQWFRLYIFNQHGFGPSFATFLFSYIIQQSVPSLTRTAAQPSKTRSALFAALATCCGLYLALGCSAAALFGDRTQPLVTLHFASFRGGAQPGHATPLWALLISRWVMLLPLLTTTAAFPLFNRVLAANLEGLLPPSLRSRSIAAALCALPPFVCTSCLHDTALVFAISGLSGFAAVFFMPALLQRAAMRASVRRWGEAGRTTPHTTPLSSEPVVLAVLLFSLSAFAQNLCAVVSKFA